MKIRKVKAFKNYFVFSKAQISSYLFIFLPISSKILGDVNSVGSRRLPPPIPKNQPLLKILVENTPENTPFWKTLPAEKYPSRKISPPENTSPLKGNYSSKFFSLLKISPYDHPEENSPAENIHMFHNNKYYL